MDRACSGEIIKCVGQRYALASSRGATIKSLHHQAAGSIGSILPYVCTVCGTAALTST